MTGGLVFAGLSAGALAALGAIGGAVLTALYLLRPRRRRVVVPFVGLWLPSAGNSPAERLARRLRRLASFALQLSILGLVLLAAGDVHRRQDGAGARTLVILIDRSASMQATDETGSRVARARLLAREEIATLRPDDRALVATFAADVCPLTGMESDRGRLRAAVDGVDASDETGDVAAALAFVAPLLRGRSRPTVVLISDGGGAGAGAAGAATGTLDATKSAFGPEVELKFVPVGRRRDNVGIVAFSARRLPADLSSAELVLVTQSFRGVTSEVTLEITAGPQRMPVARRRVRLDAGARVVTTLPAVPVDDGRLEAVLEDARDDLAVDDRAYVVISAAPPATVLVIGGGNLYLDGALLGMGGGARVDRLPSAALESSRERWPRYDVVVFDGVVPNPAPDRGGFLYLDPHGPGSPWPERGTPVPDPVVTEVVRAHPLVQQVSLADLNVVAARRLTLRAGDIAVAASAQQALLVARNEPALRQVAVAFDIRRSDLPLRSAFPLLIANAVTWLARQPPPAPLSFSTGHTARIPLPANRGRSSPRQVDVEFPDGRMLRLPVVDGWVNVALTRVGLLTVRDPADGRALVHAAANLASAAESDVGPPLSPATRPPQPPTASGTAGMTRATAATAAARWQWPWWLLATLAALLLVLVEWATFHRRLTG